MCVPFALVSQCDFGLQLLLLLDESRGTGCADPDAFFTIMHQVEIQLLVAEAQSDLEAEMVARQRMARAGEKKTPEEIQTERSEKVRMGIGKQILATISPSRQVFGENLRNITSLFQSLDEDGNGRLDATEFKKGMKRLDLGINSTQQVELLKVFDLDSDGGVDYSEFESFLIRCKAMADMGKTNPPSMLFDCAWEIVKENDYDTDTCRMEFEDCMLSVHETRIHRQQNPDKNGFLSAGQLKARLLADDSADTSFGCMTLMQRKDLISAFDQAYKLYLRKPELQLYTKKKRGVSIDDIDLFMMKVEGRYLEQAADLEGNTFEKKREDSRFRACRKLIKVGELQQYTFAQLNKLIVKKSRPFLKPDEHGKPTRSILVSHFKQFVRALDIGISEVQQEELMHLFLTETTVPDPSAKWRISNTTVETVVVDDILKGLRVAKVRNDKIVRWSADPRSKICDDILRNIPGRTLMPAIKQLYRQLVDDQLHSLDVLDANQVLEYMTQSGFTGDRRASIAGRRASLTAGDITYVPNEGDDGASFDATWCPPDFEVVMPPGSKPAGAHLTITGEVTQEILAML